jgi:hypothetical protein
VSRRAGDAAPFFQAFPRISKLFQAFCKEIPNIFLGGFQPNQRLVGDSGAFCLARARRPLAAAALRFFRLARLVIFLKTLFFPNTLSRRAVPTKPGQANGPGRRNDGARDSA